MKITFLEANQPLTKKFEKRPDGSYIKHSYPFVKLFTSHEENPKNLNEFKSCLVTHAASQHCLLKGNVLTPLKSESRAGSTDPLAETEWVCFDVDGMDNISSAAQFIMKVLPEEFQDVSYIVQHSASAGISTDGFRAHIFFLLSRPYSVAQIKVWLQYRNLTEADLATQLKLAKNAITLRYPLDITVNQNDKLIYIAAPTCIGFDDPLAEERIKLVSRKDDVVSFDFPGPSSAELSHLVTEHVNILRKAAGLRSKKLTMKRSKGGIEYLDSKSLDVTCQVTGVKRNPAGLVQLNLDGGDSWGYYYDPEFPYFLKNFKGEPIVVLKDFLPDYYQQAIIVATQQKQAASNAPFIFRDEITDSLFIGIKDPANKVVNVNQITRQGVDDFFVEFGRSPPDPIPTWTRTFDPTNLTQYDASQKQFNAWRPTTYIEKAVPIGSVPVTIEKILRHITVDTETYDRFLNWLAFIFQTRTKSGTAWILHGCPGTGKGVFFNSVLAPIFGREYCVTKLMGDLKSNFNGYMETAIFINVDETRSISVGIDATRVMGAVKNWITEPVMSIEAKQQNQRMSRSYINFIFTTNDLDSLPIEAGDRRFNVAPRQETPIKLSAQEIEEFLPLELQAFAGFLLQYEVDAKQVRTPLINDAKEALRKATLTSIDEFCTAIREGYLEYFVDGVDEPTTLYAEKDRFKGFVEQWLADARAGDPSQVTVPMMRDAFNVMLMKDAMKTAKFKSMMYKRALPAKHCRGGDARWDGWHVKWDVNQETAQRLKIHLAPVPDLEQEIKKEMKNAD